MKKIFTFLSLGIIFATGSALAAGPISSLKNEKVLKENKNEKFQVFQPKKALHPSHVLNSTRSVPEVITEVSGDAKYYYEDTDFEMYGDVYSDTSAAQVIFGDNNEVYFYDVLPNSGLGTYAKGVLEDDVITLSLPQTLAFDELAGYGFNLTLLKKVAGSYVECEGDVEFMVFDDGSLVMDLPGDKIGDYILGLVFTDDHTYAELGYYSIVYSPVDFEFSSMPQGLETETFYYNDGIYGYPVEVATDSNHIYFLGLVSGMPLGTVVVGDLNGNTATIPQEQFIGVYNNSFVFSACLVITSQGISISNDPNAVVSLNVDMTNKVISSADNSPILGFLFIYDNQAYLKDYFLDLSLKTQETLAGTPKNPFNLDYNDDYLDAYGYYSFMFTVPNVSTEGNVLNSGDLYYRIFIDGELVEFEEDEDGTYYSFGVGTEVPFDFTNGNDFYDWGGADREVGIYIDGVSTAGVQTVYKYNDTVTESAIVTLNLATGEVTEESAGIDTIFNSESVNSTYFDLSGRKINNPEKGIYILRSEKADGSVSTKKIVVR